MMQKISLLALVIIAFTACKKDSNPSPENPDTAMYFPPNSGTAWDVTSAKDLGWDTTAIQPLKDFLSSKHSKSFMILINGRIVMEEYFNGHSADADWEWNSAGKTLVSAAVGNAQRDGLLNINNKVSDYIGTGWTNMPLEKENAITVRNLLTMTSGIDDSKEWVIKANLTYVADAGTRWAYGNVFQKLVDVVEAASGKTFDTYFESTLKNKTGMDGEWNYGTIFTIYHSTTRSMARFGLLALNKGKWKDEQVLDASFFNAAINSSQDINPSYGYLWWLNGKAKYMIPGEQTVFPGALVPNAPSDMYAAMGANDQRIYVIPGKKMVVIRMGDASDPDNPNFAVSGFDSQLWEKINSVIR
jgi:CubicO group peptidase (beta-lactamase class C family)